MKRTISSKKDFDLLFSSGRIAKMPHIMVRYIQGENKDKSSNQRDRQGRVAFVAGKRVGNAVVRNRCKRVMREAARKAGAPVPDYDIVFIARNTQVATMDCCELENECINLLSRITSANNGDMYGG